MTTPREALLNSLIQIDLVVDSCFLGNKPEVVDEILTALAPFIMVWEPIENAPKDGTLMLVWCPSAHGLPSMYALCAWHDDAGFCVDELREPTHFMRLPPKPKDTP